MLLLLLLLDVMMVMVVVVVRSVSFRFCDDVSESDIVIDVVVLTQADFQGVVGVALEHHGADVIARREARVGHSAGASAALAADVHRVAQVPTGRAVAHVVLRFLRIVVLA